MHNPPPITSTPPTVDLLPARAVIECKPSQRAWCQSHLRRTWAGIMASAPGVQSTVLAMRKRAAAAREALEKRRTTEAADLIRIALKVSSYAPFHGSTTPAKVLKPQYPGFKVVYFCKGHTLLHPPIPSAGYLVFDPKINLSAYYALRYCEIQPEFSDLGSRRSIFRFGHPPSAQDKSPIFDSLLNKWRFSFHV